MVYTVYIFYMFVRKVIHALTEASVPYALVGGYAVNLHGAVRGTVDIDIVIALDQSAYERCEDALKQIGLTPRLPVTASEVFNFRDEYINNRHLTAWSFYNPANPLEVVDVLITEDARALKTVEKSAFGMKLNVASIDELIAMKKRAGRAQDIEDIKALEKLR